MVSLMYAHDISCELDYRMLKTTTSADEWATGLTGKADAFESANPALIRASGSTPERIENF